MANAVKMDGAIEEDKKNFRGALALGVSFAIFFSHTANAAVELDRKSSPGACEAYLDAAVLITTEANESISFFVLIFSFCSSHAFIGKDLPEVKPPLDFFTIFEMWALQFRVDQFFLVFGSSGEVV